MTESGLFDLPPDAIVPVVNKYAGMGADAKRTAKQAELIAAGINPGTRMCIRSDAAKTKTGDGLRCGDCTHLHRKTGHFKGAFLKCEQTIIRNDVHSTGPDMRAWWPACTLYQPREQPE